MWSFVLGRRISSFGGEGYIWGGRGNEKSMMNSLVKEGWVFVLVIFSLFFRSLKRRIKW